MKAFDDERGLLARLRGGDEAAFRAVIERYEGQVAATVTGVLGSGPDVDDIGQETFTQFFRAAERFRGDASIGTYLVRIAINLSLNELRRRKKYDRYQSTDALEDGPGLPRERHRPGAEDARFLVRQGLERLDPKFRAVVVLRLVDGYSTRETARLLGLPQGTVLSRLARGQERLREILGGGPPARTDT
jgi:RNA polymerase sigma-70 factor, ECF subfamily